VSTRAPLLRAISVVPSPLPESTTSISSAKEAESMAAPMCAASSSVMIVMESLGIVEFRIKIQNSKCKQFLSTNHCGEGIATTIQLSLANFLFAL
jgi:hypothetical protein